LIGYGDFQLYDSKLAKRMKISKPIL